MKYSAIYTPPYDLSSHSETAWSLDTIAQNLHAVQAFIEAVAVNCEEYEDTTACGALLMTSHLLTKQIEAMEDVVGAIYRLGRTSATCPLLPTLLMAERIEVDIHG